MVHPFFDGIMQLLFTDKLVEYGRAVLRVEALEHNFVMPIVGYLVATRWREEGLTRRESGCKKGVRGGVGEGLCSLLFSTSFKLS